MKAKNKLTKKNLADLRVVNQALRVLVNAQKAPAQDSEWEAWTPKGGER